MTSLQGPVLKLHVNGPPVNPLTVAVRVLIAPKASGVCRPPGPTWKLPVLVAASNVAAPLTAPFGPVTVKSLAVKLVGAKPVLNFAVMTEICGTQVAPAAGVTDW